MKITNIIALTLSVSLFAAATNANAGIIKNDTQILTSDDHEQLSKWLGIDVDLKRVFAKNIDGKTGSDWHKAVDSKNETFTVFEIFNGNERMVIGGYNGRSWLSDNSYKTSKNSFLFNLTTSEKFEHNNNYKYTYSVHNIAKLGVVFGAGYDLLVNDDLSGGHSNLGRSYGEIVNYNNNNRVNPLTKNSYGWSIGKYETFVISSPTGEFHSNKSESR